MTPAIPGAGPIRRTTLQYRVEKPLTILEPARLLFTDGQAVRKNRAVNSQTSLDLVLTAAPLASRPAADASIPLSPTSATGGWRAASSLYCGGAQPDRRHVTTCPQPAGLPSLASSAALTSHRCNKNDVLVDATKRACTASLLRGRADGAKGNRRSINPSFSRSLLTQHARCSLHPRCASAGRPAKRRITHVRKTLVCALRFAASVIEQRLDARFPICTIPNF
jgi:hypothetical protein